MRAGSVFLVKFLNFFLASALASASKYQTVIWCIWLHRKAGLHVGSCGLTRRTTVCQKWAPRTLWTISLLEISAGPHHHVAGHPSSYSDSRCRGCSGRHCWGCPHVAHNLLHFLGSKPPSPSAGQGHCMLPDGPRKEPKCFGNFSSLCKPEVISSHLWAATWRPQTPTSQERNCSQFL